MKGILLILVTLISFSSYACVNINAPEAINVSLSLIDKKAMIFDEEGIFQDEMPSLLASSCQKAASQRKFMMFAIGIENFILSDEFLSFSINDTLTFGSKDQCRIENVEKINGLKKEDRNKRLQRRRYLINHCVSFDVEDKSKTGLELPVEGQPGCKLNRIDKNRANFFGFFCFFKPKPDSQFKITPKIAQKCLEKDFYKENKFALQDIMGTLELYAAGDATGRSAKLEFLEDIKFRISQNPDPIIPTNESRYDDIPKWPTQWKIKNTTVGKININKISDELITIKAPILVNNQCEESKCLNGVCTSSCDYSQPVASEFALFDITNPKKKEYIKSWFDGGIAPADWIGMISGLGISLNKNSLAKNRRYRLEIDMNDIDYNYMMFKGQIESRLLLNPNTIPNIAREGQTIGSINPIGDIQRYNSLPSFPVFDTIRFTGENHVGVKNSVNSISRVFKNTVWPPYFTDYCENGQCILKKDHRLLFAIEFTIDIDKNDKYIIENVSYKKSSNHNNQTTIQNFKGPYFTCEPPGSDQDDDGWDDDDFGDIDF